MSKKSGNNDHNFAAADIPIRLFVPLRDGEQE